MTIDNGIRKYSIREQTENIKGITTQIYGENIYNFWHIADIAHPYISQFLEKEYPDSIILREFNKIDHIVLSEGLPVEVQSTPAYNYGKRQVISHSDFEEDIEKQLKQKTDKYGKCLFFFDSEYLRYLQNDLTNVSRINWDWFYNYIKEERLRVFTVKYDGIIKEVFLKDFEFISKISQTCPVRRDSDERILERNKLVILNNVLKWHKFTKKESDKMYGAFKSSGHQYLDYDEWLNRDGHTDRETIYYYIRRAVNTLRPINNVLALRIGTDKKSHIRTYSHYMKILGLIDSKNVGRQGDMRIFVNYSNIAEYFPGYIENKELWDSLKDRYIRYHTFCGLATGEINERDMKCQISIEKGWLR